MNSLFRGDAIVVIEGQGLLLLGLVVRVSVTLYDLFVYIKNINIDNPNKLSYYMKLELISLVLCPLSVLFGTDNESYASASRKEDKCPLL